jgi:hypothetical protein
MLLSSGPVMADAAQTPLDLDVEGFPAQQPHINGQLFVEQARVVLQAASESRPVPMALYHDETELTALVHFAPPHARSAYSVNAKDLVEKAAIVMAGLVAHQRLGLTFLEVVEIGDRVDYFFVDHHEQRSIVEVGGTREAKNKLHYLRNRKRKQLSESDFRKAPYLMTGYAATSRFVEPLGSALDTLLPEAEES